MKTAVAALTTSVITAFACTVLTITAMLTGHHQLATNLGLTAALAVGILIGAVLTENAQKEETTA